MVKCSFCGEIMDEGTGKIFVREDAREFYFCSMKCEKNMLKLKRKNIRTKWTKHYKKSQ